MSSLLFLRASLALFISLKYIATDKNRITGNMIGKTRKTGTISSNVSPAFTQALAINVSGDSLIFADFSVAAIFLLL